MSIPGFWAVVPAGGAGTRLWPLSRAGTPKFLHDLTGSGRTLIQATVDRLAPLTEGPDGSSRILVVSGSAHQKALDEQVGVPLLVEPSPRDSMPAIGYAAAVLERSAGPATVMGSFAADHVIRDEEAFHACVRTAAEVARDDWLVTIGIEPTHPATGFGYIRCGAPLNGHQGALVVDEFVEKPSADVATGYLETGRFRWNAGMFVARPGVLLDLLAESHPDLAAGLRAIAAGEAELADTWPRLTRIALDHAVAEPAAAAGRVAVVPGDFDWDDVGDFASLQGLLGEPEDLAVLGDRKLVRAVDATGLVVPGSGRTVAVVGLDDVVVVDTGDALLVTTTERAQDVKRIVDGLRDDGAQGLL